MAVMTGISSDNDIKMVGLAENENDNICWFNFDKYNGRDKNFIMEGMKKRFFDKPHLVAKIRVLQFYDNKTGDLIDDIR